MNPAVQRHLNEAIGPRGRDQVRVRVTRKGIETMIEKLELTASERSYLSSLETDVQLFDVRTDLEIAARHLRNAAGALARIEEALGR